MNNATTPTYAFASDLIELGRNEDGEMNIGECYFITETYENGEIHRLDLGADSMAYEEDEDGYGGEYINRYEIDGDKALAAALAVMEISGRAALESLMAENFYHWRNVYGSASHDERDLMDEEELARCSGW